MRKICFLIGAGAEIAYGLPSGGDFNKSIICSKESIDLFNFFNKNNDKVKIPNGIGLSSRAYLSLYRALKESEEFKNSFFKCLSDDDEESTVNKFLKNKSEGKNEKDISQKFAEIYRKYIYEKCKSETESNNAKYLTPFFECNTFLDELDGSFYYLANWKKFKRESGKLIKIFYSALYSVLDDEIKKNILKNEENSLTSNRVDKLENRSKYIELLKENIEKIKYKGTHSYYEIIKKVFDEEKIDYSIVTTNYSYIAESVFGQTDFGQNKKIIHCHGELGLFENLETKEIDYPQNFNEDDIIFPYLLLRSGVKPLINEKQIETWYKVLCEFNSSDAIIILGYGLNLDDEHILNLLKRMAKRGKDIYFVDYDGSFDKAKQVFPYFKENSKIDYKEFECRLREIINELHYRSQPSK